jgi:hypothetical protein
MTRSIFDYRCFITIPRKNTKHTSQKKYLDRWMIGDHSFYRGWWIIRLAWTIF